MKNTITSFLLALLSISTSISIAQPQTIKQRTNDVMADKEKNFAVNFLKETEFGVFNAVKGLNESQLTFKPVPDVWSIEECVKHIAASEKELWAMVEASLNQPANPEQRANIKATDTALVHAVEDRSHKSKTFAALEPANSPYKTAAEALAAFKQNREKLILFMKNASQDSLRNHVSILPIGTYDAYQLILLIGAHSKRHTLQIKEVMANSEFPKQ
ncbi:DinB family protein [Mucilaginibacter limnophilus]|uniref:DinB family protein n=1 Tax=Mucilaginibacter limnophilus TaxID=1932778 RepID=A0A437MZF3_9SPHI|nr:DinB family protein [Mucilaginibacter limnophilus]RVU03006.1 DinB family protein [Mucilaginibacter limnophilus]